jgi:hypothetical protein
MSIWHILPTNDLKEHIQDSTCHCHPKVVVMETGDLMITHSSYDHREFYENEDL